MTFPINIPKNHYKWGDYDGNVFEKNHTRNIWHHCLLEEKLIRASHMSNRERLYRWNHTVVKYMDTRFCYEVYYVPSDNGNVIHLLRLFKDTETIQNGLKDSSKPKSVAQLSKKFVEHMNKDNINSTMKRLSNNIENGLLPLNDTLTVNTFSQSSIHICMVLANFAKKLCVESNQTTELQVKQ